MAHRVVEALIGRLITDEHFRQTFLRHPDTTLAELRERGLELTHTEAAALMSTDRSVWTDSARRLDPRLQKTASPAPGTD